MIVGICKIRRWGAFYVFSFVKINILLQKIKRAITVLQRQHT